MAKNKKRATHYVDNKKFTKAVSEYAKITREAIAEANSLTSQLEDLEKIKNPTNDDLQLIEQLHDHLQHIEDTFPRMSNYIGECVLKIAQHLATRPNFVNYSFKEEMISDGIENVFLYLKSFDAEKVKAAGKKPNAFAYVTQIVYFAFLRRIEKEKKQQYIKQKSIESVDFIGGFSTVQDHDVGTIYTNQFLEMIQNNVEYRYVPASKAKSKEEKEAAKKKKKKKTTNRLIE